MYKKAAFEKYSTQAVWKKLFLSKKLSGLCSETFEHANANLQKLTQFGPRSRTPIVASQHFRQIPISAKWNVQKK